MATSAQIATVRQIALAKQYLDANGFQVFESQPYTAVHNIHTSGSYHYDSQTYAGKKHSLAADINWPGGGVKEKNKLRAVIPVIQAFGLSIIYARDGIYDAAKFHQDHLHMDVGKFTNLGRKWVNTVDRDLVVYDTQVIVHTPLKTRDNMDGSDTTKRLRAVQAASKAHGTKFPYGVRYTQAVIGAPQTGKWDANSRAAHDATVKKLETLWKAAKLFSGTPNSTWDSATDKALAAFHKKY